MARTVRIVARTNKVGIDRDVRILSEALAQWREPPAFSRYRSISPLRRLFGRRDPARAIVFLERVTARWLRQAGRYLLIPNQERFPRRDLPLLRRIDHVLCKSHHARAAFAPHHPSVHFLGFTSLDRRDPAKAPDYGRFLHLAGGSAVKGTRVLLDVWKRHPEWPTLTLLWHRPDARLGPLPANIERIDRYLPDEELRALQNRCGVHLCPSTSEGWGHYIGEAMSCGAVTVVTDGAPMNELVTPARGITVPSARSAPRKLGVDWFVDVDALEEAIAGVVAMDTVEKARLGNAARQWFEENDARFRSRLRELWDTLL